MPENKLGISSKDFYEFKKQLTALQKARGRGTELISVYITPKYPISEISGKLRDEYGQASNIKSTSTRQNVQSALEKIIGYLKHYREPPKNGVALFCGNLSEHEGKADIQLFELLPPVPLPVQFYRCESQFVLDPLIDLVETTSTYGLVVMDGKEATIAILKGKTLKVLKQITSTAHSKQGKGGQCLHEKTLVQMADGQIKEIREVKPGDKLACFVWKNGRLSEGKCVSVHLRQTEKAITIMTKTPARSILATPEHRFFCISKGKIKEKFAGSLKKGDLLATVGKNGAQERTATIVSIETKHQSEGIFYDLEVSPHENFVAQGIIVHNSAGRFQRLREEGIEYFHERIGEAMFSFLDAKNFKGVIVGGPGPAKDGFVKAAPFNYQLKIIGVVDTGYTDEYGLREVIEKSQEIIAEQETVQEKKLLDSFMREVSREGMVGYGYEACMQAVQSNKARQLLVSEEMELYELKLVCTQCAKVKTIRSNITAHEEPCDCGGKFKVENHRDLLTNLIGDAEEKGITVTMISRETPEGNQFYGTFSGLGVFQRYK